MPSVRHCHRVLAGALFASSISPVAAIQVVGDAACGYYDVDIAAFATCIDGRVVKPEPAAPPAGVGRATTSVPTTAVESSPRERAAARSAARVAPIPLQPR